MVDWDNFSFFEMSNYSRGAETRVEIERLRDPR